MTVHYAVVNLNRTYILLHDPPFHHSLSIPPLIRRQTCQGYPALPSLRGHWVGGLAPQCFCLLPPLSKFQPCLFTPFTFPSQQISRARGCDAKTSTTHNLANPSTAFDLSHVPQLNVTPHSLCLFNRQVPYPDPSMGAVTFPFGILVSRRTTSPQQ